jgi:hypothetical protein
MRLIFDDEFGEASLSPQKWLLGVNLNNQQWGSDSYFVTRSDTNLYPLVYIVSGGILTIRANYDPNFVDPTHWGRHWYSGMIIPLGADGTAASATFRRGCYEIREKLPAGKGVWPANWAVNLAAQTNGNSSGGSVELDGLESYGAFPHNFNSTVHLWTTPPQYDMRIIKTPDLTADFHIYTFCNDDTKFSTYLDGVPVSILPIYRPDTVDKFFWMTNLAMGGGWPITVPPSGHYDMEITYVRVYSAD